MEDLKRRSTQEAKMKEISQQLVLNAV